MREIVLDTETTGLDPLTGHRLVEIGCIELHDHMPTGTHFHVYINPERPMPQEAFQVHGLSDDFLADKPKFAAVADEFLDFIGESPLVIHNAAFDMKFLNAELRWLGRTEIAAARAIDTLDMARRKFPGSPVSLDALCKRFNIDSSNRTLHGALIDADLLAAVYLELIGGRQHGFGFQTATSAARTTAVTDPAAPKPLLRAPRPHVPSDEELAAHRAFVAAKLTNPLWSAPPTE